MKSKYPLSQVDKSYWTKKVNLVSLYTVPTEQEALPFLLEVKELLDHLTVPPLQNTIPLEHAQFFFMQVCGPIACKIIKSRFLKNLSVLNASQSILILTMQLVALYLHLIDSIPQLPQLLTTVFPNDQFFKSNSLLHFHSNPFDYFNLPPNPFTASLERGSMVDCIRFATNSDKFEWQQAKVLDTAFSIDVQFLQDPYHAKYKFEKGTYLIAAFDTKSKAKTEWRSKIAVNTLVDCEDTFGGWYNGTVSSIVGTTYRQADVKFKVYHPSGNKKDADGNFFGFLDYFESFSLDSIKLQPYGSTAKEFVYENSKSNYDHVDDTNDMEIDEIGGEKVYAFPRKRHLSSTVFFALQKFGKNNGFDKVLSYLESSQNIVMLAHFLKSMNVVSAYLHKSLVITLVEKCKAIIKEVIFVEEKSVSREQSEMIFGGIKALQKRISSIEKAYEFENNLKMRLIEKCMNSNVLKKKLQGISQLKEVVRTISFHSLSNTPIVNWIKEERLFEKIYFIDSHVQLIKKSDSFFKCCLSEGIVELQDINKLLKMAKKGDFETKMSLYNLLQEATHLYKKFQVEYLVDRIMEVESLSNEDIELLHYLSRHSNHLSSEKVLPHFQTLLLNHNKDIAVLAGKKYADIVAKNYNLRGERKQIIGRLFAKLKVGPFKKFADVLKLIFQGIAVGEIGRQELALVLTDYDIQGILFDVLDQKCNHQETVSLPNASQRSTTKPIDKLSNQEKQEEQKSKLPFQQSTVQKDNSTANQNKQAVVENQEEKDQETKQQIKQQAKQQTKQQAKQQTRQQTKQQTRQQTKQQIKQQTKQQTKQQIKQQTRQQTKQQIKQQTRQQTKQQIQNQKKIEPNDQIKAQQQLQKEVKSDTSQDTNKQKYQEITEKQQVKQKTKQDDKTVKQKTIQDDKLVKQKAKEKGIKISKQKGNRSERQQESQKKQKNWLTGYKNEYEQIIETKGWVQKEDEMQLNNWDESLPSMFKEQSAKQKQRIKSQQSSVEEQAGSKRVRNRLQECLQANDKAKIKALGLQPSLVSECMQFLKCVFVCFKTSIQVKTLRAFQRMVESKQFIKWVQEVMRFEQTPNKDKQNEMNQFFEELFNEELLRKLQQNQFDMFKQVVLDVNELVKQVNSYCYGANNKYSTTYDIRMYAASTYSNYITEKQCKRIVQFKNIKYISKLQYIIDHTEDQQIADKAMELFVTILTAGQNSVQQIQQIFNQRWIKLCKYAQNKTQYEVQILRSLKLIDNIIDESEKNSKSNIESLIKRRKTTMLKINLLDETKQYGDLVKKTSIEVGLNITLMQLKRLLAKEVDVPLQQIRLAYKGEFTELQNCRTLSELNFNESDIYTVTRKCSYWTNTVPLVINGQFTIKAKRAFQSIFDEYAVDGKMTEPYCRSFTTKCIRLGGYQIIDQRVQKIFKQYGQDLHKGYLTFENFCDFYLQHAIATPAIVWDNLKSFGIHSDLRLPGDQQEVINTQDLPRFLLSRNKDTYTLLFKLMQSEVVASAAFNLLERLPVCKETQDEILGRQELNFEVILDPKDKLLFFYRLTIMEYFMRGNGTEEEREWVLRFISGGGYEKLFLILVDMIKKGEAVLYLSLVDLLVEILNQFLLNCFCTKQSLLCYSLLMDPSEIDDKFMYLVKGKVNNSRTVNILQRELIYQFTIMSPSAIASELVQLLKQIWQLPQTRLKEAISGKLLNFIGFLLINNDPKSLVESMSYLIVTPSTPKQIKHLYNLILCYCFTSSAYQLQFIRELFRCLMDHTVIAQHFNLLAILVSKFGLSQINVQHTKNVLMNNIYTATNQLTIEGCARLLAKFDLSSLTEEDYSRLWDNCVFSQNSCTKDNTKCALYNLLLKMCSSNPELVGMALRKVGETMGQCFSQIKISSCMQLNQRASCGYVGLKNLGSICYINSMMQQLFMNKSFRYLIQRINDGKEAEWVTHENRVIDDNILHQVQNIFAHLEHSTRMDYIPYGFCLAYKPFGAPVNVMVQQDVQQFVSMFFDQLGTRIKDTPFRDILDNFYGGQNCNMFLCHQCQKTKKVTQTFFSISLQVKNSKTLAQSCNRFIQGETINDYTCGLCEKKSDVTKTTCIGKCPKILIIHLQRIVFNLDTFVNEKITSKHTFPMEFNLAPYTLDAHEGRDVACDYVLIGIICHIGNADAGHYISYIKREDNKWLEFNDSVVNTFDISRIDEECFGGNASPSNTTFIDDYEWDKANQTAKSAYILLYERKNTNNINIIIKNLEEKGVLLKTLDLKEEESIQQHVQAKIEETSQRKSERDQETQQDQPSHQQGEKEKQEQIQQLKKEEFFKISIDCSITPKIGDKLLQIINNDNKIHSFEKVIASSHFANFFANILRNDSETCQQMFPVLKKVTFGFWVKSPSFADLLLTNIYYLEKDISYINEVLFDNPSILSLLLQCSDIDIRCKVSTFMVKALRIVFNIADFNIEGQKQLEEKTRIFLQKLFSLIPTQVSKCWTRFGEYFEFWRDFAESGEKQCRFMLERDYLKHFIDYFLDKKSPLGIYAKKEHPIGSKYGTPNFTMLLLAVTQLLMGLIKYNYSLTTDDFSLLLHYQTLEKLLSQTVDNLAVQLIPQLCKNNLHGSEKVAIVLLRALSRNTFMSIQPYLNIIEEYILIDDQYQMLRVYWVLGKQQLAMVGKSIAYFNSYIQDQRIHTFYSTIVIENSSSLLQCLFENHRKTENMCMMQLKALLKLCNRNDVIDKYVSGLSSPTVVYGKYQNFITFFIKLFYDENEAIKKSYYHSSATTKQQLIRDVKILYRSLMQKRKAKQALLANVQKQEQLENKKQSENTKQLEHKKQSENKKQYDDRKQYEVTYEPTLMPVRMQYIETGERESREGLLIQSHASFISYLLLRPNGKTNLSLKYINVDKNIDKLAQDTWLTEEKKLVKGFYVTNCTNEVLRIKTQFGSSSFRGGESAFVWANNIQRVFIADRNSEWPKWTLYQA